MNAVETTTATGTATGTLAPRAATPAERPEIPAAAHGRAERAPGGPQGAAEASHLASRELLVRNLPPELQRVIFSTPERLRHRLRGFLIQTHEEGELLELLPELRRALLQTSRVLYARAFRGEMPPQEVDRAFARLHDSIHGVKDALLELQELNSSGPRDGAAITLEPSGQLAMPGLVPEGEALPTPGESGRIPVGTAPQDFSP